MASSTSPLAPPTFSGTSTFSSSFQQVLTRAVNIASLPVQQMQNNVNDLTKQQQALTSLESTFITLDSAIQSIGSSSTGSVSANTSDSAVSANATSGALPGQYSVQVDSLGSFTTTLSHAGSPIVTNPSQQGIATGSLTLTVNGTNTTITPSDGSLLSLATAINQANAGVAATVVNVGSNSNPDYRLAVTSTNLGADTIQLTSGSTGLLTTVSTGSDALYKVNGTTTDIQSTSRTVTVAPGLTATLQQQSLSGPTTITVSQDFSGLQSSLSNFASAYNAAVDAVSQQRGQNGGALAGQSIVYSLTHLLNSLSQYQSGPGAVTSLNDLGLQLDANGHLSFNAGTFSGKSTSSVQQFLGSATSGGFLQVATNGLTAAADTNSGSIETDFAALQTQIDNQNHSIQEAQRRIQDMQTNLMAELTKADAAIAGLQSQKTFFADLFAAQYPSTQTPGG